MSGKCYTKKGNPKCKAAYCNIATKDKKKKCIKKTKSGVPRKTKMMKELGDDFYYSKTYGLAGRRKDVRREVKYLKAEGIEGRKKTFRKEPDSKKYKKKLEAKPKDELKKLAKRKGLDRSNIKGTGEGGRILKKDYIRSLMKLKRHKKNKRSPSSTKRSSSKKTLPKSIKVPTITKKHTTKKKKLVGAPKRGPRLVKPTYPLILPEMAISPPRTPPWMVRSPPKAALMDVPKTRNRTGSNTRLRFTPPGIIHGAEMVTRPKTPQSPWDWPETPKKKSPSPKKKSPSPKKKSPSPKKKFPSPKKKQASVWDYLTY